MMTLRDVFEVYLEICEIDITARAHDLRFEHEWIYGPDVRESRHMWYDRRDGKLTIVDEKINAHGDHKKSGPEMGWGVKTELFPVQILDAKITRFLPSPGLSDPKQKLYVDIELDPITVEILKKTIKGRPVYEEEEQEAES